MQEFSENGNADARWHDYVARLDALLRIGESKVAVDTIRKDVNIARQKPPEDPTKFLLLLSLYARILEETSALAEAEYIRIEALDLISSIQLEGRDAAEASLMYGLLLIKMHNYDGALAKLREAHQKAEDLSSIDELDRQIMLARVWKGKSEACEALGELSQASAALDMLTNIKRQIRFLVFSTSREA